MMPKTKADAPPVFSKVSETAAQTQWKFEFADGRTYRVSIYPHSDHVFLTDWATGRKINAAKRVEAVRAALNANRNY